MPSLDGLIGLVEPKTLAILSTLFQNPHKLFHLNSLAQTSQVPLTSTFRIIKKLVQNQFVQETKIGKLSVYQLAQNQKITQLKKLI